MSDFNNSLAPGLPEEYIGKEFEDGIAIAYDYDCFLLEKETRSGYVYTAQNRSTGNKLRICTRKDLPLESDIMDMMNLIRITDIAGTGKMQADRPTGEEISFIKAGEILDEALITILPEYGFRIGAEQLKLADDTLEAIIQHNILMCDNEPGDNDIISCLIAAIIAKRGRINDFHGRGMYPEMQYADMPKMPIVIAVPDIELQNKIMDELLPQISDMLYEGGIIQETLAFIERKGRENYACPVRTKAYMPNIRHRNRRKKLDKLLNGDKVIDLNKVKGLLAREKSAISVDRSCLPACPKRSKCNYIRHLTAARSYLHDVQVCTHDYLLDDSFMRLNGYRNLLIPNYQALIICDAYNYMKTAAERSRIVIPSYAIPEIKREVFNMTFRRRGVYSIARETAKKMVNENARLFRWLVAGDEVEGENPYTIVTLSDESIQRHLKNIHNIAERLTYALYSELFFVKAEEVLAWVNIKYGADITKIDLNKLLPDGESHEVQVKNLYKAICGLGGVKRFIKSENMQKRKKRLDKSNARKSYAKYAHNTEDEAISNIHSSIESLVWKQAKRLLRQNSAIGDKSSYILWLISYIKNIRDKAAAITAHDDYYCRVRIESEVSNLYAYPKELGKKIVDYHRDRKIPAVLMSGTLPEGESIADFEESLGLGG